MSCPDSRRLREELEETGRQLRRQRAELEKVNAELAQANEVNTRFVANIGHEIRTPLNAINGFAELLAADGPEALSEEQRRFVDRIIEAGQHLLQLVNDVIDIAKVEAGAIELDAQPTRINTLVEQTVRVVTVMARERGVALRVAPGEQEPVVLADGRRVKQVLFNLLGNAIRYAPAGTTIDVAVANENDAVRITVSDQGMGIAAADHDRVFQEFVRVGTVNDDSGGAGLGLPLSQKLVQLHGGEIGVDSALGEGSTFWFTLPLARPPDGDQALPGSIAHVGTEDYRRRL